MTARLCLNMIVKNEAKILERCLASVAPWISCYAIADTGSTDGTPELIRKFFEERKIPGVVQEGVPFEDFSQARNAGLEVARSAPFEFDYMLLTDADMELIVEDEEFRAKLSGPAYMVTQASNIAYGNVRLLRREVPCRYIEPTHEYLSLPMGMPPMLKGLWFRDWGEGSSRSEKTERDLRLLRGALEVNPHNARAHFYLAQTLKDTGQWVEAIEHYRKRIALGGFDEEVWYSQYMIANCTKDLLGSGERTEADYIYEALKAFEMRPTRAEPMLVLTQYFRDRGRNDLAVLFAQVSAYTPKPNDVLFVEPNAYEHGFDYELSIAGFYSHSPLVREEARQAALALSVDPHAPAHYRDQSFLNVAHSIRSLAQMLPEWARPSLEVLPIGPLTPPLLRYTDLNPSIYAEGGRIFCNVRWMNYELLPGGHYVSRDEDRRIRTENQLCELDPETLAVKSAKTFRDVSPQDKRLDAWVLGYEDVRIFRWQNRWWGSATVRDRFEDSRAEQILLKLEETDNEVLIEQAFSMRVIDVAEHQKNWVPIVRTNQTGPEELLFLQKTDPTNLVAIDPVTYAASVRRDNFLPSFYLVHERGSSQGVPFDFDEDGKGGFLYVTHQAFDHLGGGRLYTHRFVYLNADLAVARISDPFYICEKGIEFCCGLAIHGDRALLSFGVKDRSARIASVDIDAVRELLSRVAEETD